MKSTRIIKGQVWEEDVSLYIIFIFLIRAKEMNYSFKINFKMFLKSIKTFESWTKESEVTTCTYLKKNSIWHGCIVAKWLAGRKLK